MPTHEEFTGVFGGVRWQDPTYIIGWTIDNVGVKGQAEPGELVAGRPYKFFGKWTEHPKYGKQFEFICAVPDIGHTREAVVDYLVRELREHNTGIGEARAHKLYDLFGSDAVRKLRTEPAEVAKQLRIKQEGCHRAALILEASKKIEHTKLSLMEIFGQGQGWPRATIAEVIKRWGPKAPAMIKRDAFLLLTNRFKGAGFHRTDELYLRMGGDPGRLKRQALCAWHSLIEDRAGHTWFPVATAVGGIRAKIDGCETKPGKALRLAIKARWLSLRKDAAGKKWLAPANRAKNEAAIAAHLARLLASPRRWPELENLDPNVSKHQRAELAKAIAAPVGILAGTPGTGKTFTAAALLKLLVAELGPGEIEVVAPTGKAAVRISEAMQDYGLPCQGKTIHRLLQPLTPADGHAGNGWGFRFNEMEPLECSVLVVDESSMIETDLMADLLKACRTGTQILFLGDPYQLPPVGHGAPLRDFLAAGIAQGELTEVRRNAGTIVRACRAIKDGDQSIPVAKRFRTNPDSGINDNLIVLKAPSSAAVLDKLASIYIAAEAGGRDLFEDVQILVALNKQGDASRVKLNRYLQRLVNPDGNPGGPRLGDRPTYQIGDKVICTSNGKYLIQPTGEPEAQGHGAGTDNGKDNGKGACLVFNGEQGRVVQAWDDHTVMRFPDLGDGQGVRLVKVPIKSEWDGNFDLGYAITVHKAQGCEWPVVVVVGDEGAWRIAGREWWYTAVSRASDRCVILGSLSTVARQVKNVGLERRKTFLRELLELSRAEVIDV